MSTSRAVTMRDARKYVKKVRKTVYIISYGDGSYSYTPDKDKKMNGCARIVDKIEPNLRGSVV